MSVADVAKSVIKSINAGDTLATVGLPAADFHEGTVKLATVLLGKKLGGIYITTSRPSSHIIKELEDAKANLNDLYTIVVRQLGNEMKRDANPISKWFILMVHEIIEVINHITFVDQNFVVIGSKFL